MRHFMRRRALRSGVRIFDHHPALELLGDGDGEDRAYNWDIKPPPKPKPTSIRWSKGESWLRRRRRREIPLENKRDFLDVSGEIVERVDPVFFSDPMTAAMKALGMT